MWIICGKKIRGILKDFKKREITCYGNVNTCQVKFYLSTNIFLIYWAAISYIYFLSVDNFFDLPESVFDLRQRIHHFPTELMINTLYLSVDN